jgi:glycosyltransferase involved in cell wall biosynthesis
MRHRRFYFIEPSKVGRQHITLIEGYLSAIAANAQLNESCDLLFCASKATFSSLHASTREKIAYSSIPVMNPEKRRLFLKTLLEFAVVLKFMLKKRPDDVVFVSCVLPTTLLLLELANIFWRRRGVFITLHGEIEGLFDKSLQGFRSYGYWILMWMRLRRPNSVLSLVVIDDFIKHKLIADHPRKMTESNVFVVHHPISPLAPYATSADIRSVCFVGYRTKAKGFEQFERLSHLMHDVSFVSVGGGFVENLRSGQRVSIVGNEDYLRGIAQCTAAIFPYIAGYTCSLSAAVMDALSAGVQIVASNRPCFLSLAERFGTEVIAICNSIEEAEALMEVPNWFAETRALQLRRIERLSRSPYSVRSVGDSFQHLVRAAS